MTTALRRSARRTPVKAPQDGATTASAAVRSPGKGTPSDTILSERSRTNNDIPFPASNTTRAREENVRGEERQRNRSQGAASQRGTSRAVRRDTIVREGLRPNEATARLGRMKEKASKNYYSIRERLGHGLQVEDIDDEEEPEWLTELFEARNLPDIEESDNRTTARAKMVDTADRQRLEFTLDVKDSFLAELTAQSPKHGKT
ncbi:hypothetical protein BDZ89DRAFT_1209489 [Hymenopellis radicata]|nr:hypothetical protein BDZ89DRAFT_1209489 [Hymenopellis radicata]